MNSKKTKLELTWIGKDERTRLEPRILIEEPDKSYHAKDRVSENDIFDNKLIFGDNLLALKALEAEYAGQVKCIYIDPPYNTGNAFEHYEDGLEHSLWMTLIRDRLEILKNLLSEDGTIFVQIDDVEQAYLRIMMDEIFGRGNFINTVSVKMKDVAGVSGGGEDKKLKKNIEYIHLYAKNYSKFNSFKGAYEYISMPELLETYRQEKKNFAYTSVLIYPGDEKYIGSTVDGSDKEIKIYARPNAIIKTIKKIIQEEGISEEEAYNKYADKIFRTTNNQSPIKKRAKTRAAELGSTEDIHSIKYVPNTGRNAGETHEQFYKREIFDIFAWLRDVSEEKDGKLYKKEKQGTYWDLVRSTKGLSREGGGVKFSNGKKPEALVGRIIHMATDPGDLVLDSFAGSGTTGAVAHKMGRRWIMIEMGDHCDSHILPRMKGVINNEDRLGVSKTGAEAEDWKGGGGFRYYRLAPSMLEKDKWDNWVISKEYNAGMLAEAMCKHMGFTYEPDESRFWVHGRSTETDFIYITTSFLTHEQLRFISEEVGLKRTLLICCKAFKANEEAFDNLTLKKIPQAVLTKCEWGKDDYSLDVASLEQECEDV